jgi:hypothetical protein
MKQLRTIVGLAVALIASVGVSVAPAATVAKATAWTESKAEKVVLRDARLGLEAVTRSSLEEELRREVLRFRSLEILAVEEADESIWWTYHNWGNRYQEALGTVQSGLRIDHADCAGAGRTVGGARFTRFHCLVTSEVLRIPSTRVEIVEGQATPAVVEGAPRELGPYLSQLRLRVTGKSTFQYR